MVIVYDPKKYQILNQRIKTAESILEQIPAKHCFISGSFLYKDKYNDIDIFVISRTKKKAALKEKNVKLQTIDFNDLHSLFYHSIAKSCIAKNILPAKELKVTIADYWQVVSEAIPSLLNNKNRFRKTIRNLILYTEYLISDDVLDSFQLSKKIEEFKNFSEVMDYIQKNVPAAVLKHIKKSYAKRFFYTQAGNYKSATEYDSQRVLYSIAHQITKGAANG